MFKLDGKFFEGVYEGKNLKKGSLLNYVLYTSSLYDKSKPAAFCLTFDGLNTEQVSALEYLAHEGEMPPFVALGVFPGRVEPTLDGGIARNMRKEEYDVADREFPDFLVDELIPEILAKHGIKISDSPDLHMISGGSSGGIAAWTGAWYRNDFFRRAFISSPSFLAMGMGEDIPFLVKKLEARPIKICLTLGEHEPDDYFGSSYPVGLLFERSLNFAGYDYEYSYFPNEGHCCRIRDYESQIGFMRYLWKDALTNPVKLAEKSKRIVDLIGENSTWCAAESTDFKSHKSVICHAGTYEACGDKVYFIGESKEKTVAAEGFGNISALAVSADKWRLYIADRDRRYIYAMSICADSTLKDLCKLGTLHLDKDCRTIGAYDMTVDSNDRLYIATDMGVQCMRSYGIVDIILPLPNDIAANSVMLCGHILYAQSGEKCFARTIIPEELQSDGKNAALRHTGYYD
ncbi:MAG: hypothetical protein E7633_05695 [Ruminococcaceae bacterium]|nr:hypothetical protein [Oscillospiraceae bacterium]